MDGPIPVDILYAELSSGKRTIGRPQLRFKDVCKYDLKSFNINPTNWKDAAQDRLEWQHSLHSVLLTLNFSFGSQVGQGAEAQLLLGSGGGRGLQRLESQVGES